MSQWNRPQQGYQRPGGPQFQPSRYPPQHFPAQYPQRYPTAHGTGMNQYPQFGNQHRPGTGTWQQPYGGYGAGGRYPNYYGPPARQGRGAGLKIIGILFLLVLGGFVLLTIIGLLSDTDGGFETPPAEYQNESYELPPIDTDPPDLPWPSSKSEATLMLTENSIYDATVAVPVRCEAAPIDPATASNEEIESHLNMFTGCLMRVFAPALESQGFTAVRPSVTVYSGQVQTRCGTAEDYNAAYCAADQQVYYADNAHDLIPNELAGKTYAAEAIIAHEFGHAIQARTGILLSERTWEVDSDEAKANNFSRRLETQADCFAGVFVNSVGYSVNLDEQQIDNLSILFYSIGDDQLSGDPNIEGNHGHGSSRSRWFKAGADTTAMGTCNTFIVDDPEVR